MLTLGIPATPVMAIMMTALIIQGVQPGPLLVSRSPDVFWGVVMSMYLGNIMLLVLNLPLIGMWVKLLKVPYAVLFPLIILFCLIGAYGATEGYEGIVFMLFFGVMGYVMRKFEYEPIPMVFALILGPLFERSVCQSLIYSHGNFGIFFRPPIALSFLVASIILFAFALLPFVKRVLKRGDSAGRVLLP
jgi:putative tricarboxylic transport membrane protein